jgi:hypothetical protein
MFANWPIEQFVASLSDPSMGMVANPDTKQNANIPFWGAPSGYDWQGKASLIITMYYRGWKIAYVTNHGICHVYIIRMGKFLGGERHQHCKHRNYYVKTKKGKTRAMFFIQYY